MIGSEADRAALKALGLSEEEASAYLALSDGPRTGEELAQILAIDLSRASELQNRLVERGLIHRLPGPVLRFALTPPEWTLPGYLRQREEDTDNAKRLLDDLMVRFQSQIRDPSRPAEYLEVVNGNEAALAHYWSLLAQAEHEAVGFVKEPILSMENPGAKQALKHGVGLRWLWDQSLVEKAGMLDAGREWVELGEQIRLSPGLPAKLAIVDGRTAHVMVTEEWNEGPTVVSLLTRHPELVATLHQLFELLWADALPLFRSPETDESTGDRERLIACLAAGMKDETIARQLGISHRTVTRRVQDLLADLSVETRFQAGLKLGAAPDDQRVIGGSNIDPIPRESRSENHS